MSETVVKLIAAPKFLIAQTSKELVTICNASGLVLARKTVPTMKNIEISKVLDELFVTVVSTDKVEIFKVDLFGKAFDLIWKIEQENNIESCIFGSSATVYKNALGKFFKLIKFIFSAIDLNPSAFFGDKVVPKPI